MAGKKPAKKNISNTKEVKKELPGKATYFFGLMTEGFTCPTCKNNLIKGIIYEYQGNYYCKRYCFPKEIKVGA